MAAVLLGELLLQVFGRGGQLPGVGMLQYGKCGFVGIASRVPAVAGGLQFHKGIDIAVYGCLRQWKSHGYVYVLHFRRDGVQHG